MKPNDFPQFPDPHAREVFAAAANLVEDIYKGRSITISADALKTALFAAQHSRPKTTIYPADTNVGMPAMAVSQHDRPWQCKKERVGVCCTSEECRPAQHSKRKEPPCIRVHGKETWCEKCTHEKPIKFDKWGYCVDAKFGLDMAQGELDFLLAPLRIHPPYPDEPNAAREWYLSTQVK